MSYLEGSSQLKKYQNLYIMKNIFNRILIASDLSEMDDQLMAFIQVLSKQIKIEKMYLYHIIPNMLVPANSELEFHKMFSAGYPIDEKVRDVLKGKSLKYFENADFDIDIEVVEGKAYQTLLDKVKLKEIDLLVVGSKKQSEGSGITTRRIVRKAESNVLFVPPTFSKNIKNILVPIDFSEYSIKALKMALDLAGDDRQVTAVNVVSTLLSDQYYGMTMNPKFRQSIIDNAWEAFDSFQKSHGLSNAAFEKDVIINNYNNVASELKDYVQGKDFDMVVMGAKGHSVFENFLLGSVTESFVNTYTQTPVLVIR